MSKYRISQKRYNALVKEAAKIAEDTASSQVFALNKKLTTADDIPTIKELQQHNIGEFMTEEVLQLLIFYSEFKCINKEEDEWVPIYTPDPMRVPKKEFEKLQKYCGELINEYVEIV